jgi:hypothetical protein
MSLLTVLEQTLPGSPLARPASAEEGVPSVLEALGLGAFEAHMQAEATQSAASPAPFAPLGAPLLPPPAPDGGQAAGEGGQPPVDAEAPGGDPAPEEAQGWLGAIGLAPHPAEGSLEKAAPSVPLPGGPLPQPAASTTAGPEASAALRQDPTASATPPALQATASPSAVPQAPRPAPGAPVEAAPSDQAASPQEGGEPRAPQVRAPIPLPFSTRVVPEQPGAIRTPITAAPTAAPTASATDPSARAPEPVAQDSSAPPSEPDASMPQGDRLPIHPLHHRTSLPAPARPSMAATPEALFFTVEYDAGSAPIGRTQAPAIAPSLTAQLAAASRAELPVGPAAMPEEVSLLIRDPDGDIRLFVGREDREVAVKLEVPTGLMAAVQEAEAPIRAGLAEEGFELDGYEVQEREEGLDRQAERERTGQRTRRRGRQQPSAPEPEARDRDPGSGLRLLNRRA